MRNTIALLATSLCLAACTTTTGVVPIGDGIYMLSTQDYTAWSGGKLKAALYADAAAHCKAQGKEPSPVSDSAEDATFSRYASAEIKFRCK